MNLIYLFSISLLTELTSILFETPPTIEVEKLFKSLSEMPSDFYSEERVDEPPQEREVIQIRK